jgi:hypothetical protein
MAAVPNPLHGFCRALAAAERAVMPTLKERLPHIDMNCGTLNTQEYERLIEKEREQEQESETETAHDGDISVDGLHQVNIFISIDMFFLLRFNRFYIMVNVNLVIHIDLLLLKIQKILHQRFD